MSYPPGPRAPSLSDLSTQTDLANQAQPRPSPAATQLDEDPGLLQTGARLDRYVIIDPVGAGGMGVVYRAYDPELDRRVAIKVVRSDRGGSEGRDRILREAQALARLSHPNVVPVHDAGATGSQVFLVMEFVEGETLRDWLARAPHGKDEIIDKFLEAGQGLAAAHRAGLVHRDFKPRNVVVGADGRVRVLDFGLARATGPEPAGGAALARGSTADGVPLPMSFATGSGRVGRTVTHAGTVVGTPPYMAPEQLRGRPATAATDQFAFAVALHEALTGRRPFSGDSVGQLLRRIEAGRMDAGDRPLAGWLRKVLERALRPLPHERYVDMDALLAEVGGERRSARRRFALAALVGLALVLVGWGVATRHRAVAATAPCLDAGAPAALAGTWDPIRREAIVGVLGGSERVVRVVDAYTTRWLAMRQEVCEATHVRHDQSAELHDLRMACLARRRTELAAYLSLVRAPVTPAEALQAAQALPSLELCADANELRLRVPPPQGDEARHELGELEGEVATATALFMMGRFDDATRTAEDAIARARKLGYAPILAEALFARGMIECVVAPAAQAVTTLYEAQFIAESVGHDRLVADTRIWLMYPVGFVQGRVDEAERLAAGAEAALQRLGGDDELAARYHDHLGSVRFGSQRRFGDALALYRRGLELNEKVWGSHLKVGLSAHNVAVTLHALGRFAEARTMYERAEHEMVVNAGIDNPYVVYLHADVARLDVAEGELDAAAARIDRAVAILDATTGRSGAAWAQTLEARADLAIARDRLDDAFADAVAAREAWSRQEGEGSRAAAQGWLVVGRVLSATGDHDAAAAAYGEAADRFAAALGQDSAWAADVRTRQAAELVRAGHAVEGLAALEADLAILRASPGAEDALARPLLARSEAFAALGRGVQAAAALREAMPYLQGRADLSTERQRAGARP